MARVVRAVGWAFVTAGCVVLLYLVYALVLTGLQTDRAQAALRQDLGFEMAEIRAGPAARSTADTRGGEDHADDDPTIGDTDARSVEVPDRRADESTAVDVGDAFAAMWFARPGRDEPPVRDEPVVAVEGVSRAQLQRGPGHYPGTALPGQDGNVVISGHRTTYGAPFFRLDELQPGDRIHMLDRARQEWVYEVRKSQVVAPTALWVLEPDPLGTGAPTLTLTTCHPRFSSAQRLIVFAELVGEAAT